MALCDPRGRARGAARPTPPERGPGWSFGECLVPDRCQGDRNVGGDGNTLGRHHGQHGGYHGRHVGELQGDRVRILLCECSARGRAAARAVPDKRSLPATCVATDSTSGRIATVIGFARTSCVEIDRPTWANNIVLPDLVDVIGERRAVEQLSVEVPGDQPEGGENCADDNQDPDQHGRAHQHGPPERRGFKRCSAVAELDVEPRRARPGLCTTGEGGRSSDPGR